MFTAEKYACPRCRKLYSHYGSMTRHYRLECGVTPQFRCHLCDFVTHRKGSVNRHYALKHPLDTFGELLKTGGVVNTTATL